MSYGVGPGTCEPVGERGGAIPANMGVVKAQVLLWDHDPFYARPNQNVSYPLNSAMEDKKIDHNFDFSLDCLTLKADCSPQNMFVATVTPKFVDSEKTTVDATSGQSTTSVQRTPTTEKEFDFVEANGLAATYLPPHGSNYNETEFGHRLWLHIGSLYKNGVILHPSEYGKSARETLYWQEHKDDETAKTGELVNQIQSAPRWEYHTDSRKNTTAVAAATSPANSSQEATYSTYWPYMISKQSRLSKFPVHWTLEKYAPVWQGCDFFVIIKKGDKTFDYGTDQLGNAEAITCDDPLYQTMMYKKPSNAAPWWIDNPPKGITNKAFFLDPSSYNGDAERWGQDARRQYHFEYKPYILIEVGHEDLYHNYILELCYGRNPRFLHISEYWDTTDTTEPPPATSYKLFKSCRVLAEYKYATSDALLNQEELTIKFTNHLGRIVVSFSGHEKKPFVVDKLGQKNKPPKETPTDSSASPFDPTDFMVVPASRIRIHGGNISCMLDFGYTKYALSGSMTFPGQSMDTHHFSDSDLYLTMSNMGTIDKANRDNGLRRSIFAPTQELEGRLGKWNMSYDCDAKTVHECIRNQPDYKINLYKYHWQKALSHGKGFTIAPRTAGADSGLPIESSKEICIRGCSRENIEGEGHSIRIYNAPQSNTRNTKFKQESGDSGDGEYVSSWTIGLELTSGDIDLASEWSTEKFTFSNVLTPILTHWRFQITGDFKPTAGMEVLDISPLVTNISDHWAADVDGNTFNHEMNMTCYIPVGYAIGYNPLDDPERIPNTNCRDDVSLTYLSNELYKLHDRAFYVTVKYWWGHPGVGYQRDPDLDNEVSGTESSPTCDDSLIQMTGICYGGQFEISANKMFMHLKVCDYMDVLKKQFIFNSPFFDGCSAHAAIYELAKIGGFDDCTLADTRYGSYFKKHNIDRRPLGFIESVMDAQANDTVSDEQVYVWNGEQVKSPAYGLPISYATLSNPAMRFPNGETLDSCMKIIAKQDGSIVYFDRYGVLKYEVTAGLDAAYSSDTQIRKTYKPKIEFFTSPLVNIPASDDDAGGGYDPDAHRFSPDEAAHLVYNVVKYSRDVENVFNQIVIGTAVPDHKTEDGRNVSGYYYIGHCFYDQIFDPNTTGFLGFRKSLFQSNGVFGGVQEAKRTIQSYAGMSIPWSTIEFETYGMPCLKPHDIISVDGNLFFIAEISHTITPGEAPGWWMNITGEWMRPYRGDLGLYKKDEA